MYALGVMAFVLFLSTRVGVPVLPELSVRLGAAPADVPLVVSAALATVVVAQFFTGGLADRYSRRSLVVTGAVLGAVTSLLTPLCAHWTQLLGLRVLGGLADAVSMPALLAITATLANDRPGRFFGILRAGDGFSFVVGPLLGGLLSLVSLQAPFVADGLLSLVAGGVAFALLREEKGGASAHSLSALRRLRAVFSDRSVYLYLLLGLSGFFGFGILSSFVPAAAQAGGLDAWRIGVILGAGALVFSMTAYVVGSLSDRLGRRGFVLASLAVIIAASAGLALSDRGFVPLLALYCLFCVGETAAYILSFSYAAEAFDHANMGTAMGAFDSALDLSLIAGPLVGIGVYQVGAAIAPVFLLAGLPALIAVPILVRWLPHRRLAVY